MELWRSGCTSTNLDASRTASAIFLRGFVRAGSALDTIRARGPIRGDDLGCDAGALWGNENGACAGGSGCANGDITRAGDASVGLETTVGDTGKFGGVEIFDGADGLRFVKDSDAADLISSADELGNLETTVDGSDKPDEINIFNGADWQGLLKGSDPVEPAGAVDLFDVLEIPVAATFKCGGA